jgi:hypothetical protein
MREFSVKAVLPGIKCPYGNPSIAGRRQEISVPTLNGKCLDWGQDVPKLAYYLGRIEKDEGAEAVLNDGSTRVIVPHATVFCFAVVCFDRDLALCRLSPVFGHA